MARKTDITGRLLLLIAAAYALILLISLTGSILTAKEARDFAADEVRRLTHSVVSMESSSPSAECGARNELKMVCEGERTILCRP